jgi:hypothetical protein
MEDYEEHFKHEDLFKTVERKLPRAVFSRPDVPFHCEVRRHKSKHFYPRIQCSFEDYLPAFGQNCEKLKSRGYGYETISLFFPQDAEYLMPPFKLLSKDEYPPFEKQYDTYLSRRFITKFYFPSFISEIKLSLLKVSRIYQSMFEKYPENEIEEKYYLNEAKQAVRNIIADNPIVKVNDKKEIIDGPF